MTVEMFPVMQFSLHFF